MLEEARRKLHFTGRLMELITLKLNRRGLSVEQRRYDLTKQRVVAIRLTDKDILEAEKHRLIPPKLYKFYLDGFGQIVRVSDRAAEPDVLMYLTFGTFYALISNRMTVTEAYRAGKVQVRYVRNVDQQEETFLQDAGVVLRLMTEIMREMAI